MTDNIYNKMQKIFINNYDSFEELSKKEKKIYNDIWNEIIDLFIYSSEEEKYDCVYVDSVSFTSELNLLLLRDGFRININKNNGNYVYHLTIKNETIQNIINDDKTKTLQR